MPKRKLTDKQKMFIEAYTRAGSKTYNNATQSAIEAGYSKNGADVQACNLLGNIKIKEAIDKRIKQRIEKKEQEAEITLSFINKEMLKNYKDLDSITPMDSNDSIQIKREKRQSLMDLAKTNGLIIDKVVNGNMDMSDMRKEFENFFKIK